MLSNFILFRASKAESPETILSKFSIYSLESTFILDKLIRDSTVFASNPDAFIFTSYCKTFEFSSFLSDDLPFCINAFIASIIWAVRKLKSLVFTILFIASIKSLFFSDIISMIEFVLSFILSIIKS